MTGPEAPYLITEDDDTTDYAAFWHIRDSERWAIAFLLDKGLEHSSVKFNPGLKKLGAKLRDQFKQGL